MISSVLGRWQPCRLPLQLSSNLCYLKCTRDPERWLVLSSANCQPTELIRTVKTRTAGSHSTDWLTEWWKEVCWWAISAAQDSIGFWIIILRSQNGSSLFFLRHQPDGYQESQNENRILSVCRKRGWKAFLWTPNEPASSILLCSFSMFIHHLKQR